jgi:NAD-dependent DNA ligase
MDKSTRDKIARVTKGRVLGRQEDHLIGFCNGLIADNELNQKEAESLQAWLAHAEAVTANPMLAALLDKLSVHLKDGVLDEYESQDVLRALNAITDGGRGAVGDRAKTTFLGFCQGLIADGKINQQEAEALKAIVEKMPGLGADSVLASVAEKVKLFLSDGRLDHEEAQELQRTLQSLTGGEQSLGEVAKSSTLPICSPPPEIVISGSIFCLTGMFGFSRLSRTEIKKKIESLGGKVVDTVTKKSNYLIIGTYVSDAWMQESYGRKIERAMELREEKGSPAIVSEEHFLRSTGLA